MFSVITCIDNILIDAVKRQKITCQFFIIFLRMPKPFQYDNNSLKDKHE